MLQYFIMFSTFISIYFLYKIWRSHDHAFFKVLLSIVVLVPFVGPIFYLISSDNKPRSRDNLNADGDLFGRGRYTEWWGSEKIRMAKKIKVLEEKAEEDNKSQ
ncbi:MAG TPA: hypothetical protein DIW64_09585 [Cellvibrio sp.]|nr:hypothetical protein [Cellvibrio sp.]